MVSYSQAERALAPQTRVLALLSAPALHGNRGRHAGCYGPGCEKFLNLLGKRVLIYMPAECQEKWRRVEDPVNISAIVQRRTEPGPYPPPHPGVVSGVLRPWKCAEGFFNELFKEWVNQCRREHRMSQDAPWQTGFLSLVTLKKFWARLDPQRSGAQEGPPCKFSVVQLENESAASSEDRNADWQVLREIRDAVQTLSQLPPLLSEVGRASQWRLGISSHLVCRPLLFYLSLFFFSGHWASGLELSS